MHAIGPLGSASFVVPPATRASAPHGTAAPFQQMLLDAMRKLDALRQPPGVTLDAPTIAQRQAAERALRTAQQLQGAVMTAYNEIKEMGD
jgi:flagellar hook-basal body complex protein FliE